MINEVNDEKDTTEDRNMMMSNGSKVGTKVTNNVGDEKSTDYTSSEADKKEDGAEEEPNNTKQSRPQSPNINHNIRRHSHQRIGRRRSDMSSNNGTTSTRRRSSLFAVDEKRQSLVVQHSPSPSTDKDSISTPSHSMGNSMTNSLQGSSTSVGGSLQGSFSSDYDNAAARNNTDGNSLICSFGRMDSSISIDNSSFNSVDYVNNNSLIVGWDRQVSMLSTESSLEECHGASNVTFPSENLGVAATSPGGAMFDPTDLMRN